MKWPICIDDCVEMRDGSTRLGCLFLSMAKFFRRGLLLLAFPGSVCRSTLGSPLRALGLLSKSQF